MKPNEKLHEVRCNCSFSDVATLPIPDYQWLISHIQKLEESLSTATEALKIYANHEEYYCNLVPNRENTCYAKAALAKITKRSETK